jgi:hypothetical protein
MFVEEGRVAHIVPRQTMDRGKGEMPDRRPDQVLFAADDAPALHDRKPDRASAVRAIVCGLKVNGCESGHDDRTRDASLNREINS